MPKKEELCVLKVFREVWKVLEAAEDLEDAKAKFQAKILDLVLNV